MGFVVLEFVVLEEEEEGSLGGLDLRVCRCECGCRCEGVGRTESQRRERSQVSRDARCWGVRRGRGKVRVEIVCVRGSGG